MFSEHPNQIAVREAAGLRVELAYLPIMDMVVLTCTLDDVQMARTVDKGQAHDAFHHPMLYLAPTQVEALGVA